MKNWVANKKYQKAFIVASTYFWTDLFLLISLCCKNHILLCRIIFRTTQTHMFSPFTNFNITVPCYSPWSQPYRITTKWQFLANTIRSFIFISNKTNLPLYIPFPSIQTIYVRPSSSSNIVVKLHRFSYSIHLFETMFL